MKFLEWFFSFFPIKKALQTVPFVPHGTPYRTPPMDGAIPVVESQIKPPRRKWKLIDKQKWINKTNQFKTRMAQVMKISFIIGFFFAGILGIGLMYDLNMPLIVGLRVCAGICCGILSGVMACMFIAEMDSRSRR